MSCLNCFVYETIEVISQASRLGRALMADCILLYTYLMEALALHRRQVNVAYTGTFKKLEGNSKYMIKFFLHFSIDNYMGFEIL